MVSNTLNGVEGWGTTRVVRRADAHAEVAVETTVLKRVLATLTNAGISRFNPPQSLCFERRGQSRWTRLRRVLNHRRLQSRCVVLAQRIRTRRASDS